MEKILFCVVPVLVIVIIPLAVLYFRRVGSRVPPVRQQRETVETPPLNLYVDQQDDSFYEN